MRHVTGNHISLCCFRSSLLRRSLLLLSIATTQEIVWEIASQLRLQPDIFPVPDALSLPPGKQDSRRIMSTVYQLFKGLATEQDLALAGLGQSRSPPPKPPDEFYALFYLALYNDARGDNDKSLHYMRQALHTTYAQANNSDGDRGDYMVAVARVSACCIQLNIVQNPNLRRRKSPLFPFFLAYPK